MQDERNYAFFVVAARRRCVATEAASMAGGVVPGTNRIFFGPREIIDLQSEKNSSSYLIHFLIIIDIMASLRFSLHRIVKLDIYNFI